MSFIRSLGPVNPSGDGYEYFACPNCAYAQIQVQNGAIDYAVGQGASPMQAAYPGSDDTLLPGSGPILGPLQAIRFKNHSPVSSPAPQVSIRGEASLPLGANIAPGWTPSYATIAADGSIGANFSGHVKAKGVDFDVVSTAQAANEVRWLRTSDGAIVAEMGAIEGPADILAIQAHKQVGSPLSQIQLQADTVDVGNSSLLNIAGGPLTTDAAITATAGGRIAKIIDGANVSSFLQLASDGNHKLALGSKTITWPGASVTSNILTVAHGLGTIPAVVLANVGTGVWAVASVWNFTSTQFTCQLRTVDGFQPANTATTQMPWAAIT